MHKRLVINIISKILLFVTCFMMAPLAWAFYDDAHSAETAAFVISILIGLLVSFFCLRVFPIKEEDYDRISVKDGLSVVGLSWICLSLFGALPLYLSHTTPSFTDAIFEITSGFTTTGATIFTDVEALPRGILFWRSLTHWLGGMGIIVLYLALLPALGPSAFQLFKAESPGLTVERIEPRIRETAKMLWSVYFFLSFCETALLMFGGMSFFDALCHTFGTMATGGFSTKNASIAAYDPYIQWVIIIFMFFAGMNFMLHYQVLRGRPAALWRSEEWRYYVFTIVLFIPFFAIGLAKFNLTESPVRDSVFQILAILTTTGYTSVDYELWPHVLQFSLILMMFVGGCGGSTSGGMKISRISLANKIAQRSILQTISPNAVIPIRLNHTIISDRMILGVVSYFIIFVMLFFLGMMVLTFTEDCDIITAFTASISALSNIGPGLGDVGPTNNYAWFSAGGKWFLTFLMLAGRLELYSILILLLPSTWRR